MKTIASHGAIAGCNGRKGASPLIEHLAQKDAEKMPENSAAFVAFACDPILIKSVRPT